MTVTACFFSKISPLLYGFCLRAVWLLIHFISFVSPLVMQVLHLFLQAIQSPDRRGGWLVH